MGDTLTKKCFPGEASVVKAEISNTCISGNALLSAETFGTKAHHSKLHPSPWLKPHSYQSQNASKVVDSCRFTVQALHTRDQQFRFLKPFCQLDVIQLAAETSSHYLKLCTAFQSVLEDSTFPFVNLFFPSGHLLSVCSVFR